MTPQEYQKQQKAKLVACYNIEKSTEVKKNPQVIDIELITDRDRLSDIKKESFENDVIKSLDNKDSFLSKAFNVINKSLELFEKGGEGSRGGKIIGHTKSGKPIYSHGYHTDYSSKNYSSEDHEDISNHHSNVSKKSETHYGKETTHSKEHKEWAEAHKQFSKEKAVKK